MDDFWAALDYTDKRGQRYFEKVGNKLNLLLSTNQLQHIMYQNQYGTSAKTTVLAKRTWKYNRFNEANLWLCLCVKDVSTFLGRPLLKSKRCWAKTFFFFFNFFLKLTFLIFSIEFSHVYLIQRFFISFGLSHLLQKSRYPRWLKQDVSCSGKMT